MEKGAVTRKKCANGCIACKKCERECPVQAIVVENNLAKINYEICNGCGHCAEVCPVKCINQGDYRGANSNLKK
jgi:Pyruvate/2-oxoacid:ferredoxin oxidoreductase delta subunit